MGGTADKAPPDYSALNGWMDVAELAEPGPAEWPIKSASR